MRPSIWPAVPALLALAPPAAAQSFAENPAAIPQDGKDSENLDFADVDLDGDWDVAIANGGDFPPQQNQLWINQGGLSGGTLGVFLDETVTRLPQAPDPSRDVEFADVDGDGDHDLYVAGHSTPTISAGPRWWINQGGAPGGTVGYYQDETAARWVGLGGPGSSIAPSHLLADGSFLDWSADGDFADLDADGDLDLVHSSHGPKYSGQVPTRIFLNDGLGFFAEHNPSGFQLAHSFLLDGDPALWCEGVQQGGTTDVTGAFADVAEPLPDFALADTDGDFDVDMAWGGVDSPRPRFFRNRLESGTLIFRDLSAFVFPGVDLGGYTYDTELADMDGDLDLDLFGVNWGATGSFFHDVTLVNQNGQFVLEVELPGSAADDEEADVLDYDHDGDLDVYVGNFSGQDKLYENVGPGIAFVSAASELPSGLNARTRDVEACDVDGDGDVDVFLANANGHLNTFLENLTQTPDTTSPSVTAEPLADLPSQAGERTVRARVLDNAAPYQTWYYDVVLTASVDGFPLPPVAATCSRGSAFRAALPANLVGQVGYRFRAIDHGGNAGASAALSYVAAGAAGTSYGAESGAAGAPPPALRSLSSPLAGMPLFLGSEGLANAPVMLGLSLAPFGPLAVPGLPNLVLNVDPGAPLLGALSGAAGADGRAVFPLAVPPTAAGISVFAQAVEVAPDLTLGSSKGLRLDVP